MFQLDGNKKFKKKAYLFYYTFWFWYYQGWKKLIADFLICEMACPLGQVED